MRAAAIAVLVLASTAGCRELLGIDPAAVADAGTDGATDAAPPDTPDAPPDQTTRTFRQGVAGYSGVIDTHLDGGAPNQTRNTSLELRWRTDQRYALIRFEGLIEDNAVPSGATILSATLSLIITNGCDLAGQVSEVAIPWDGDVTFNTFGLAPGVDASDVGAAVADAPFLTGPADIDVTASLARWVAGTANHGWIIQGDPLGGAGDCSVRSSEDGAVVNRPQLTVTFR